MKPAGPDLSGLIEALARQAPRLDTHRGLRLDEAPGSYPATFLSLRAPSRALVLVEDADRQVEVIADLRALAAPGLRVLSFPGPHLLEGRALPRRWADVVARLSVLEALRDPGPLYVVATPEAVLAPTLAPETLDGARLRLAAGDEVDRDDLVARLLDMGYRREDTVGSPGEVASRGGIVDVFPPSARRPVRLELWGDEVETLRAFDPASQRSTHDVEALVAGPAWELPPRARLPRALEGVPEDDPASDALRRARHVADADLVERLLPHLGDLAGSLVDHLPKDAPCCSMMTGLGLGASRARLTSALGEDPDPWGALLDLFAGRPVWDLAGGGVRPDLPVAETGVVPGTDYVGQLGRFLEETTTALRAGEAVALACAERGRRARIRELFEREGVDVHEAHDRPPRPGALTMYPADLGRGFRVPGADLRVIGEADLWRQRGASGGSDGPARGAARFSDFTEIEEGCLVVHVEHGIGKFLGIRPLLVEGLRQDYLEIEYAKNDRLFVPTSQLDRVQRFIGVEGGAAPKPGRLGGTRWRQATARARADAEELARELLKLYAKREAAVGHAFPADTVWQRELEEGFPFEDTRDQGRAVVDVKRDMEQPRPMDRLICGDVGFGKTEVAVRAAFKAVQDGKQVAVLAPTTVLAQQHFQTFSGRLTDFPVRVAVISRLRDPKEVRATLRRVKRGEVDIVVGTHRLLSKDVRFRELGLLIIDEEQRFGVKHKERIKELKASIDVLTLTATPIPRTLNLALSGARDISTMTTPPKGRLPVRTFVQEWDEGLVRGAIERELARGGQVFYVHNRIETLGRTTALIEELVPSARVRGGHAQMDRKTLENLMFDLYEGAFDVLVSTTIIENGLDIPNVNTILVDRADRLGMSQLYQLRGRVGRTSRQAYAYLLYPKNRELSEVALKRLKALEELTDLGSGFRVAMRDLELRGAGSILGSAQHGFVNQVGFELYTRLLRQAVAELKGKPEEAPIELCAVDLPVHAYIPEDYVPTYEERIQAYRALSEVPDLEELEDYRRELVDRYGPVPDALGGLFRLVELKLRATELGIGDLKRKGTLCEVTAREGAALPEWLVDRLLRRFRKGARFSANGVTLNVTGVPESKTLSFFEELLAAPRELDGGGPVTIQAVN